MNNEFEIKKQYDMIHEINQKLIQENKKLKAELRKLKKEDL